MKDYIIELVTGQKHVKSRVKAANVDNLRRRLIGEGVLSREEKVVIYSTNSTRITPSTPFPMLGVIWYDGYNDQVFWMDKAGKVSNVAGSGALGKFKLKG